MEFNQWKLLKFTYKYDIIYEVKDCKCREIHSTVHHGAILEQCAVTGTIQESYKKGSPKDKCSKEPSSKPCLCHAHKM